MFGAERIYAGKLLSGITGGHPGEVLATHLHVFNISVRFLGLQLIARTFLNFFHPFCNGVTLLCYDTSRTRVTSIPHRGKVEVPCSLISNHQSGRRYGAMSTNPELKNYSISDLKAAVAKDADVSQAVAGKVINAFLEQIKNSLAEGHSVSLLGYFSFKPDVKLEREIRNPRTGEKGMSTVHKKVKVTVSGSIDKLVATLPVTPEEEADARARREKNQKRK